MYRFNIFIKLVRNWHDKVCHFPNQNFNANYIHEQTLPQS